MSARKFLIPSLLAAGFLSPEANASLPDDRASTTNNDPIFLQRLKFERDFDLAAHRSHASHSSHGSHRSSSGSSYKAPVSPAPAVPTYNSPLSNSTAPSSVLPSSPQSAPLITPPADGKYRQAVMKVQIALQVFGYFSGTIDGTMGPDTMAALASYQRDSGMKATGKITSEILHDFGIKLD